MEQRLLTEVKGVGPALAAHFARLGIHTVADLCTNWPRRYDDYSLTTSIDKLQPGLVTVEGTIDSVKGRYVRRGMHITEAVLHDKTGSVRMVWFNQPYRATSLKSGQSYYASGTYELRRQRFAIQNPTIELVSEFPVNTARIVPIYRETKGLTSRQIRSVLQQLVSQIRMTEETLPPWLVKQEKLLGRGEAMLAMHFPDSSEQLATAKRRLGFEEVFELSLASLLNKQENQQEHSLQIPFKAELAQQFSKSLPFTLTDAQRQVIMRIYKDLEKDQPMNRLVEGDVGSGKTVVATMAAVMALEQGYQVAFMAPTELLARQHADTIHKLLKPLKLERTVGLLVGSMTTGQKSKARAAIGKGDIRFIIGTQALIQETVAMQRLALIVIDEQHRFGVDQRKQLMAKAGVMPHVLSLTATPIPRSLALTLYGELDVSRLTAKPVGRLPIKTQIVSPNSRPQVYEKITQELQAGRQLFVVCPLISESVTSKALAAEKVYEQLRSKDFSQWRVGLLHGKLKTDAKNDQMEQFVQHKLDILVATTVIEVGVDVSNATVMLIEGPEQFGLAQMHQLRGRVGRSSYQGYCYLMMSDSSAPSRRLRALESSNDGFRLSELDLELRGPGAIYGLQQHGQLDLRIAKLDDRALIVSARTAAQTFIDKGENLLNYEELATKVTRLRAITNLN